MHSKDIVIDNQKGITFNNVPSDFNCIINNITGISIAYMYDSGALMSWGGYFALKNPMVIQVDFSKCHYSGNIFSNGMIYQIDGMVFPTTYLFLGDQAKTVIGFYYTGTGKPIPSFMGR